MPTPLFNIEVTLKAYESHIDLITAHPYIHPNNPRSTVYLSNKGIALDRSKLDVNHWIVTFGKTRYVEDCSIVKVKSVDGNMITVTESKICPAMRQILHYCAAIRNNNTGS